MQSIGAVPPPYDTAETTARTGTSLARLNSEWTHRFGPEARGGMARRRRPGARAGGQLSHRVHRRQRVAHARGNARRSRDTTITASGKLLASSLSQEHSLVSGIELESNRRADTRTSLQNGAADPDRLLRQHRAPRRCAWPATLQDEWSLSEHWGAHAGLRWEGIRTHGSVEEGQPADNQSSVWTPLLHAVWKPDPKGRDQVRFSLTRSYRSPSLSNLISRPSVNTRYPVPGPNTPTQADRAGNPNLKPELATGIDIAVERYLAGSGLLSANIFPQISNYMRSVTTLETVSYATVPRYVSRAQNVGDAMTQGLELEAKFRAQRRHRGRAALDVRANASVFSSRVKSVPGPDNRLDQQPDYTANLGADYRFAGMPLMSAATSTGRPATHPPDRRADRVIGKKLVVDAYGLWTFNPALALRLSLSNLDAHDYLTGSSVDGPDIQGIPVRETSQTRAPTFINVQLRLEMKL